MKSKFITILLISSLVYSQEGAEVSTSETSEKNHLILHADLPLTQSRFDESAYSMSQKDFGPPLLVGFAAQSDGNRFNIKGGFMFGTPISRYQLFYVPNLLMAWKLSEKTKLEIDLRYVYLSSSTSSSALKQSPLGGNSWATKVSVPYKVTTQFKLIPSYQYVSISKTQLDLGEEDGEVAYSKSDYLWHLGVGTQYEFGNISLQAKALYWGLTPTAIVAKNFGITLKEESLVEWDLGLTYQAGRRISYGVKYTSVSGISDTKAFMNRALSVYDPYLSSKSYIKGVVECRF